MLRAKLGDLCAQKTVTINDTKYTTKRLRKLAENGVQLKGEDTSIILPCGADIAVRDYGQEGIAVLNWGGVQRKGVAFGDIIAFLA